ncbi:MAG: GNAT family N-acetyltransferase [Bacteroidota bacterium]
MITIGKAELSDVSSIVDFQLLMADETEKLSLNRNVVEKGVSTVFSDPNKGFYLVAREENRVIASLMITYEWSDWRAKTVWWIQSLYVIPEKRRQGIFRRMFDWLVDRTGQDESVGGLKLYVDKSNLPAQKVYEDLGFNGEHYRFYEYMKP